MDALMSAAELARWNVWKRASENVMSEVAREIANATGLSAADFSVLTRLIEEGEGSLRQQRLADDLGWERSRLSRHLARMESRGLVSRSGTGPERWIHATAGATDLTATARAAHARAVRGNLLDSVPEELRTAFWSAIEAVAGHSRNT